MRMSRKKILCKVRKKLYHPNEKTTIIVVHNNTITNSNRVSSANAQSEDHSGPHFMSKEDMAAISIQAYFRGYLARRMFKALKSLVKLQAIVRGVSVRRQAQLALHCMHALARLQVTVRARQLR
ncbi:protein IQ-DOMAIN 20-like [Lycium ferocissimum]|uniref:protein IQ-DOMAIN 20-like n=1 Tax=Lycium ferocissimum TaxID=112874 RepID=UPI00281689BB|nr:protein IQ-DOMAIN 20-like [Lycium ferocissimum]